MPLLTKQRMLKIDTAQRKWTPATTAAAKEFLAAVPPLPQPKPQPT